MQSFSLSSRKALSPKNLPKLSHGKGSKIFREASADMNCFVQTSPNNLFIELERKLLEQQKEIVNRESEVKKVISKFESIAVAHKDQKNKYSKILTKYIKVKSELTTLKEQNEKLSELLTSTPNHINQNFEEKISQLKQELEKK